MLVIEAAVLHCVTSVQDNIEKKFGKLKHSYNRENAGKIGCVLRKLAFCICENKGHGSAAWLLCFCYIDSKSPLLSSSEISSL